MTALVISMSQPNPLAERHDQLKELKVEWPHLNEEELDNLADEINSKYQYDNWN